MVEYCDCQQVACQYRLPGNLTSMSCTHILDRGVQTRRCRSAHHPGLGCQIVLSQVTCSMCCLAVSVPSNCTSHRNAQMDSSVSLGFTATSSLRWDAQMANGIEKLVRVFSTGLAKGPTVAVTPFL
eukprot:GHRR01030049.1.p1 GENE.GHRR01030049.1~~GHRR01030049.1.p1  ORF type:complete len:126 (+),score=15.53 GHRR01030049.1:259-636(+)